MEEKSNQEGRNSRNKAQEKYQSSRKQNQDLKSGNADDKVYVEFLNTYDNVKKEMKQKKGIKEEKTEKKKVNASTGSFNRKFGKLTAIDNYISKNRKNFTIEGVQFYMALKK